MPRLSSILLRVFAIFALVGPIFGPLTAQAQPAPPVGVWNCVVNSPVVSIELQMQVSPDQTLFGRGTIVYIGTSAIYNVQGYGDWAALPPDQGMQDWLFKFRMQPQNHAIFSWFANPTSSPGNLYNQFQNPETGGIVETACQRVG